MPGKGSSKAPKRFPKGYKEAWRIGPPSLTWLKQCGARELGGKEDWPQTKSTKDRHGPLVAKELSVTKEWLGTESTKGGRVPLFSEGRAGDTKLGASRHSTGRGWSF